MLGEKERSLVKHLEDAKSKLDGMTLRLKDALDKADPTLETNGLLDNCLMELEALVEEITEYHRGGIWLE